MRMRSGPWQHRCWIFPRDPHFAEKAGRILDLYERVWDGQALKDDEFVLSADEKTSIQGRRRRHRPLPTQPASPMKVEHEYTRCGAWAFLAALDVHRGQVFGRCETMSGISFDRFVAHVMNQPPYNDARRVFLIMGNGSSHRGDRCVKRLQGQHPNLVPVHGPVHASCPSLGAVAERIAGFERYYESIAKPSSGNSTVATWQRCSPRSNRLTFIKRRHKLHSIRDYTYELEY